MARNKARKAFFQAHHHSSCKAFPPPFFLEGEEGGEGRRVTKAELSKVLVNEAVEVSSSSSSSFSFRVGLVGCNFAERCCFCLGSGEAREEEEEDRRRNSFIILLCLWVVGMCVGLGGVL